jgi:hypothetical protein
MSEDVEKKVEKVKTIEEMEAEFVEPEIEPVKGWKGLLKVTEVRMLLYVVPVALILLIISLVLKANK